MSIEARDFVEFSPYSGLVDVVLGVKDLTVSFRFLFFVAH
jgi:hypothetical protein